MNSSPRRPAARSGSRPAGVALLNVLHLLAELLELRLRGNDQFGNPEAVSLGSDGVDLPVHLLAQEIQLASARLVAVAQGVPVGDVGAEAGHLFADVRPARH